METGKKVQPLSRVLQQISDRAQTCVLVEYDVSVTLLPEISLLALSPPALCPVSAPAPRRGGADPHGNGSISAPAAPAGAAWKVPTAAVGACPPAKPAALPAPMQRQPRYFWLHLETRTFSSGNDAKRDGFGRSASPSRSRPRVAAGGRGRAGRDVEELCASKGSTAVHLAAEARPLHTSSGIVLRQWDPEIRVCSGTESPRSLLQPPGARRVVEGVGSPQALCFSFPKITPSADQLLQHLGAGAGGVRGRRELSEVIDVFNPWLLAQGKPRLLFMPRFPQIQGTHQLAQRTQGTVFQMYKPSPPNDVCGVWDTPGFLRGQELEGCLLLKEDWW
ncbi:uncharacterized protein LOC130260446 [Oenanthe melanoleuca]|uniref:uncharacterized protein LOC130260446 n=1 Tax=Oenanthe melanoleuca TaxID=2939378 RepID=UPI0024C157E0|nr:uncharacterized protein LOC130260446 [Oenanthe melanoleuca]